MSDQYKLVVDMCNDMQILCKLLPLSPAATSTAAGLGSEIMSKSARMTITKICDLKFELPDDEIDESANEQALVVTEFCFAFKSGV